MSARCCLCEHVFHVGDRIATTEHVSHRDAETCREILRRERDHAVAVAFWQGVSAERATEADDRAERRGDDAKFYGRVGNAIKAMLASGSVGFARTAATKLRAWALAEVPRG